MYIGSIQEAQKTNKYNLYQNPASQLRPSIKSKSLTISNGTIDPFKRDLMKTSFNL